MGLVFRPPCVVAFGEGQVFLHYGVIYANASPFVRAFEAFCVVVAVHFCCALALAAVPDRVERSFAVPSRACQMESEQKRKKKITRILNRFARFSRNGPVFIGARGARVSRCYNSVAFPVYTQAGHRDPGSGGSVRGRSIVLLALKLLRPLTRPLAKCFEREGRGERGGWA